MSRNSKLRAREQRRKEKRQRKAAEQAKYEAWKQAGINNKSRRSLKKRVKATSSTKHTHPDGFCGNPGCKLCFPVAPAVMYVSKRPSSYFRRHNLA